MDDCRYRLMQGDCLSLMADIPDGSVDMVLCDPPYGTTKSPWDAVLPFEPMWGHLKRICKENAAIVLFSAEPFTSALISSNPGMFRYDLVWEKSIAVGFLNAKKMPMRAHENICVFYRKPPTYNPQKSPGDAYVKKRKAMSSSVYSHTCARETVTSETGRYPRSVLRFKSDGLHVRVHPNQKPVALLEYLVQTYTDPGQTVLDFTMGGGSTGVASMNAGRRFIGIERDPAYFKAAEDRIAQAASPRLFDEIGGI